MKYILILLLLSHSISPEEKMNFEKYKKTLDATVCKKNKIADCLAYKFIQHYHPNAKDANWYRNTAITHYFDYKVNYQNEREKGDIQFSFQSYLLFSNIKKSLILFKFELFILTNIVETYSIKVINNN